MLDFIFEFSEHYKIGDIVLIEYWYDDIITPVKILEKIKRKNKVTHNISESKIQNAPDKIISSSSIIDKFKN